MKLLNQFLILSLIVTNSTIFVGNSAHGQETVESNCGKRLVHNDAFIPDEFQSNEGDWPWHAAIYHIQTGGIKYKCGGTVLNANSILTAAHCVYESNRAIIAERVTIYLGKHDVKYFGTNTQEFQVYKIIPHPNFNISDLSNDISIIRLSTEATFNNYVQPICLSNIVAMSDVTDKFGIVIGFGDTDNNESRILRQVSIPVVSLITCRNNRNGVRNVLFQNNFCAGYRNGTNVCKGDSGGSMTFEENGIYHIRGIVSLAVGQVKGSCNSPDYVLFTDVAKYLAWIEEAISQSSSKSENHGQETTESTCGRRLVHHTALITHGFQSNEGDFPWHAAIYHFVTDSFKYKCGGTVINSNSILTAAHCVFESNRPIVPRRITVHLGKHDIKYFGTNTQEFQVYRVIPHPNYNTSDLSNDIAIIRLSTEATFNNYVRPICLWNSNKTSLSEEIGKFGWGTVIGWGITEDNEMSQILRQAYMPVVSTITCLGSNRQVFRHYLSENNFCAGFRNGTSICNGDSGGSMTFEENGVYRIRGIVSLAISQDTGLCKTSEYVLFTDVAKYLTWIDKAVFQFIPSPSKSDRFTAPPKSKCLVLSSGKMAHYQSSDIIIMSRITVHNFDELSLKCSGVLENCDVKGECQVDHFKCETSGECIQIEKVCDGAVHCADGNDETLEQCSSFNCPSHGFRCVYGGCVNGSSKCDGKFDCADNSDERLALCVYSTNINNATTLRPITKPTSGAPGSCLIPDDLPDTIKAYYEADSSKETPKGSYAEPYSSIIYKCDSEYELEGSTNNLCVDGQWVGSHPVCLFRSEDCLPLAISEVMIKVSCELFGEKIACNKSFLPQSIAHINCAPGYRKPMRPIVELYCGNDGEWDYNAFRCEKICREEAPKIVPDINEGKKINTTKVPWHVGIYSNIQEQDIEVFRHICVGTIINAKLIISAAHCFWDTREDRFHEPIKFKVAAGKLYRDLNAVEMFKPQVVNVAQILFEQEYNDHAGYYGLDIVVLTLADKLDFNIYVKPICVEAFETEFNLNEKYVPPGLIKKMTGWGIETSGRNSSTEFKYIDLPAIEFNDCKQNMTLEQHLFIIGEKLCADYASVPNVCHGHSEGLVFAKSVGPKRVYYLKGTQKSCDNFKYSVFTNIQFHIDMIRYFESEN